MSHLNKILISLILLLTFSCSMNVSENTQETGKVNIAIPNISPRLLDALEGDNSRAYTFIDKIELIVSKEGSDDLIITKDFTLNEYKEIVLILEAGDYTVKANIYNLVNSETEAVVSGEGEVTITSDSEANLKIVLLPTNPVLIEEGVETTISDISHTEYIQYITYEYSDYADWIIDENGNWIPANGEVEILNEAVSLSGKEYWYEFSATSGGTDFKITNPIDNFSPAILTVYTETGKFIKSTTLLTQKIRVRTVPEAKYLISIIPVKVKNDYGDFYEDEVTFTCTPYTDVDNDGNTSIETAEVIDGESVSFSGRFNSFNDVDYYQIDLLNGQVLENYNPEGAKIEIIDSTGSYDLDYYYTAIESGSVYLKIINDKDESDAYFSINLGKQIPLDYINQYVINPDNWRPNFNPESLVTKTVNSETGEVTVNYDMSSENNIQYPHAELLCEFDNFSLNGVDYILIEYKSDKDIKLSLVDGTEDFSAYAKYLPATETYNYVYLYYHDFILEWGEERDLDFSKIKAIRFDGVDKSSPGEFTIIDISFGSYYF